MSHNEYIKIFTGDFITVSRIVEALEEADISPVIKDRTGSGLTPLFGASNPSVQEIHVNEDEMEQAVKIVAAVTAELQTD